MEATLVFGCYIGIVTKSYCGIWVLYWDSKKQNGSYYSIVFGGCHLTSRSSEVLEALAGNKLQEAHAALKTGQSPLK